MQPGAVRKLCGSVLALLVVSQAVAHLDRLLSQDTLDYIGYYDNLVSICPSPFICLFALPMLMITHHLTGKTIYLR